jgi:preprotein translocase subunit SecD
MSMVTMQGLARILVPLSVVVLAACQSLPAKKGAATSAAPAETTLQATNQGAPVAVYLADTTERTGWTPVQIQNGTPLYVNPQPVITRNDLSGVKAGSNKEGQGLLALDLNDVGKQKVNDITTKNPNKRLALVVGRTMLAAPAYTTPVGTAQLVFPVGTEANAIAAARAIAGTSTNSDASSTAPAPVAPAAGSTSPNATTPAR